MTTTKSLIVAALLSTFAAVSFAQAPAPVGPHQMQRHHHKHHGHHHHHHHHMHRAPGNR
jgi:Spy/CpxP family protein refolding chaperone